MVLRYVTYHFPKQSKIGQAKAYDIIIHHCPEWKRQLDSKSMPFFNMCYLFVGSGQLELDVLYSWFH